MHTQNTSVREKKNHYKSAMNLMQVTKVDGWSIVAMCAMILEFLYHDIFFKKCLNVFIIHAILIFSGLPRKNRDYR